MTLPFENKENDMKTNRFLLNYLNGEAIVTICNDRGSILFEGKVCDMRLDMTRPTTIEKIEGLGSHNDIIITVRD